MTPAAGVVSFSGSLQIIALLLRAKIVADSVNGSATSMKHLHALVRKVRAVPVSVATILKD